MCHILICFLIFCLQYGDILNIIVSSKKKGSAVVEFATVRAAVSTFRLASILYWSISELPVIPAVFWYGQA